jgi:hypothetical protein
MRQTASTVPRLNVGVEFVLYFGGQIAKKARRVLGTARRLQVSSHGLAAYFCCMDCTYFTLPVFRLEVIVNFGVPCLQISDDVGAAADLSQQSSNRP